MKKIVYSNVQTTNYVSGRPQRRFLYTQDELYSKVIYYYFNGNMQEECYYKERKLHNSNGAAVIKYDKNQNVIEEKFYLNGKEVNELVILMINGNF